MSTTCLRCVDGIAYSRCSQGRLLHFLDGLAIVIYNIALIGQICVQKTTKYHDLVV